MIFRQTRLAGAFEVDVERKEDSRGFFARMWSEKEFRKQNIQFSPTQTSVSYNRSRGTLRGMHYQAAPHQECKLVRCVRGAIFDVIIDLRADSATYKGWMGLELNADNYKMLYIPKGLAHGFQTLVDDTEVLYLMSDAYNPQAERGVRWNDSAFAIEWPTQVGNISTKDSSWPDFAE
jgi:dTDP-4-dehydrorhamnose 3,5-epimerase